MKCHARWVALPLDDSIRIPASRYRLTVVAADVADAVGSAGGWLFDRARAGWDVTVAVAGVGDPRPLQILGVTQAQIETDLAAAVRAVSAGSTLAINAQLLATDEQLRDQVGVLVNRGAVDVAVWGGDAPAGFGTDDGDRTEHVLSAAARAFKTVALKALDRGPVEAGPTESLLRLGGESSRRLYAV